MVCRRGSSRGSVTPSRLCVARKIQDCACTTNTDGEASDDLKKKNGFLLLTYVRTYLDGGGRSLPSPLLGHALQNNWDKPARSGHALHIVWNKPAFVWTRPLACLGQVQSGDRPCNILGTSPLLGTAGKRPVRLVAIAPAQLVQGYVRTYVRTYV